MRLWIAQGFGIGRIPFAPGTFGSVLGLAWFGVLIASGHFWSFLGGIGLGFFASVWLCGYAEKLLKQPDPGSVVLDEITAVPMCFVSWVGVNLWRTGDFPGLEHFFKSNWLPTLGVLAAFRLFDIWKPWPVRQSQRLAGGWGITVDDFLAALYVAVIGGVIAMLRT